MYFFVLVLAIFMFATLGAISIYNRIIREEKEAFNAFSQIDVQLKRRFDLIPNLVETVKGYAAHESKTLEAVIKARNIASKVLTMYKSGDASVNQVLSSASGLEQTLSKLMMVSENYPELKADKQFSILMDELSSTENRIAYSRQAYNDSVMIFNQTIEQIPNVWVAQIMNRTAMSHLEVINDKIEREAVKVSF